MDRRTQQARTLNMQSIKSLVRGGALLLCCGLFSACETTDGGAGGTVYYGTGFYDPWYHGDYYYHDDDIDIDIDGGGRPRPEHPIARPPGSGGSGGSVSPRPTPMPSIPSMPRAMPRGGRR